MSQLSYSQDPTIAMEGGLVDAGPHDVISKIAQATVPFGHGVTHHVGGEDSLARVPAATGEVTGGAFFGVAIGDVSYQQPVAGAGYAAQAPMPVLKSGRIWVISEDAVATIGLPAFCRFAAGGGGTALGAFRTDADTATAVAVPGAKFASTCLAGGLVQLQLA